MRKFFYIAVGVITCVVFVININIINNTNRMFYLSFEEVEALADGEYNDWTDWFSQGLKKDEREMTRPCPTQENNSGHVGVEYGGISVEIGGSQGQTNPSGRNEIVCPYGDENCTPVDCD